MSQEQAAPAGAEASLRHSSSFDLLRKRLADQGKSLLEKASALNAARLAEFGREEMALRARTRARTDNNCTARDLVLVGVERLDRFEQRGVLRAQPLRRGDDRLDQPRDVGTANGDLAAGLGDTFDRAAVRHGNCLVEHASRARSDLVAGSGNSGWLASY